ncbi:MAG: class I poly(R)-hydroxyalkanoic acid synthase [Pseudomonadota bacterium]
MTQERPAPPENTDSHSSKEPKSKAPRKKAPQKTAPKKKTAAKQKAERTADKAAAPKPKAKMAAGGSEKPKAASQNAAREELTLADYEKLAAYLSDVSERAIAIVDDYVRNHEKRGRMEGHIPVDPLNISDAFMDVFEALAANPAQMFKAQLTLWKDYAELWRHMTQKAMGIESDPVIEPPRTDKRFRNKAWSETQILDFMKQSYLITARWLQDTVAEIDSLDDKAKKRAQFYTKQFVDALSPTNFALTNPDVMEETLRTKGENLLIGLKNLLEDLDRGDGVLAIRQTDMEYFHVGENVATAPGKVVYQNDILQLIQYTPSTENVCKRPLVIFPPWINKFYILDLREENSFIRWMVDQGRTVFLVSWVNPGPELADKTFENYMREGVFETLDAVEKATGEREVDAIGYCIGGTLLSTALAYMGATGDDRIKSATYFAAQADFSEAGELLVFIDEEQIRAIEKQMDAGGGVLEAQAMSATFNMLRSNDLVWSFVINNYLMGKDPKRFDLLYWNADATRMSKALHTFYLREFYLKNALSQGDMEMDGVRLNLGDIKIPVYMQSSHTDHIAPYRSVYNGAKKFGGLVTFMCAGSGHIAGVINHPDARKYQYWINNALPDKVETWWDDAEEYPGSWWPNWIEWLNGLCNDEVPARDPAKGGLKPIENAPGAYVKVTSLQID